MLDDNTADFFKHDVGKLASCKMVADNKTNITPECDELITGVHTVGVVSDYDECIVLGLVRFNFSVAVFECYPSEHPTD